MMKVASNKNREPFKVNPKHKEKAEKAFRDALKNLGFSNKEIEEELKNLIK
jgi:Holliday junction resolvasome RuvABC DNA-binding subunit